MSSEQARFRDDVRGWLASQLRGPGAPFGDLVGLGGPGNEHEAIERRRQWERTLGAAGWIGAGWPTEYGGQGLAFDHQVIFHEEYVRADAPGRLMHMSEQLLGPTLLAYGSDEQRARFLPGILAGEVLWCQGYSEPEAGSDLAGVRTRAVRAGEQYVITGQKVWTSLAHLADWCFVLARTDPQSDRHRGLSYLLVPMDQPGVTVRPIVQSTGTAEFNEVFFDDAVTDVANRVGEENQGWAVAMGTLAFERGVATLGQQIGFERELDEVIGAARGSAATCDERIRVRLQDARRDLRVMRATAERMLSRPAGGTPGIEASISKLQWSRWHRALSELAVDVGGAPALHTDGPVAEPVTAGGTPLHPAQARMLFSRADTIYGGSDEVQRNIIAEHLLGLPRSYGPNAGAAPGGACYRAVAPADTSELRSLSEAMRSVLDGAGGRDGVRRAMVRPDGDDEGLWATLVGELEIGALLAPDSAGGLGLGLDAAAAVLGPWAGSLMPGPLPGTLLGTAILARCDSAAAGQVLQEVLAGGLSLAVGFAHGDRLRDYVDYVEYGAQADRVLIVSGDRVALLPDGPEHAEAVHLIDATRRWARLPVTGRDVTLGGATEAAYAGTARDVLAAAGSAAGARSALAETVQYLRTRTQFGAVIGSFQALAHRAADLAVAIAGAEATAQRAVERTVCGHRDASADAALAADVAAQVYRDVAADMIQLHGAIALTWEHDAPLHFKRAKTDQLLVRHRAQAGPQPVVPEGTTEE